MQERAEWVRIQAEKRPFLFTQSSRSWAGRGRAALRGCAVHAGFGDAGLQACNLSGVGLPACPVAKGDLTPREARVPVPRAFQDLPAGEAAIQAQPTDNKPFLPKPL